MLMSAKQIRKSNMLMVFIPLASANYLYVAVYVAVDFNTFYVTIVYLVY